MLTGASDLPDFAQDFLVDLCSNLSPVAFAVFERLERTLDDGCGPFPLVEAEHGREHNFACKIKETFINYFTFSNCSHKA